MPDTWNPADHVDQSAEEALLAARQAPSTLIPTHPLLLQHADGSLWCGPVVYLGTPATLTHDGWLWDGHGLIGLGAEQPGSLFLDTRRPEVYDHLDRWLNRVFGRTPAARFRWDPNIRAWVHGGAPNRASWKPGEDWWDDGHTYYPTGNPCKDIDITDSSSAIASVVRWALAEVEAGRLGKEGTR